MLLVAQYSGETICFYCFEITEIKYLLQIVEAQVNCTLYAIIAFTSIPSPVVSHKNPRTLNYYFKYRCSVQNIPKGYAAVSYTEYSLEVNESRYCLIYHNLDEI